MAAIARSLSADEIVVVTSRRHAARAGIAFRVLLRGTRIRVSLARAHGPLGLWGLAREAAAWPAVSILLARSRRRA